MSEVSDPGIFASQICAIFVLKRGQRMKLFAVKAVFVVHDVLRDEVLEEGLLQIKLVVIC